MAGKAVKSEHTNILFALVIDFPHIHSKETLMMIRSSIKCVECAKVFFPLSS